MIKRQSYFKDSEKDKQKLKNWVAHLEQMNGYKYEKQTVKTCLGNTQVYSLNSKKSQLETLVIFPGYRTTSLIWDLDRGLQSLAKQMRIFLIETNGQPNLSDGNSPSIKSLDYGKWGAEVFDQLKIESTYITGASFGGLICMKIALVIPNKIKSIFLLNPGCFRKISFKFKNLYYNLLPIIKTTEKNIKIFLNQIVFCKPNHQLSIEAESLLIKYLDLAITKYKDNTEKPYYMNKQLDNVSVATYMLVGENDILIPQKKSVSNAKKHLKNSLKEVKVFNNAGHGIECHNECINYIEQVIQKQVAQLK